MAIIQDNRTALLLFTRSYQEEALVKDFSAVNSLHSNRLIAGHLISHAEKTARITGLPCFVINSGLQHGNTFGEKLSDAFSQIFSLGFESVIAIGNDCPTLTANDLQQAANQLKNKQAVIGPASDGGLYLIGLHTAAFNPQAFSALPWETAVVNEMMQEYLNSHSLTYIIAEVKEDIDFGQQLEKIIYQPFLPLSLQVVLQSILRSIGNQIQHILQHPIGRNIRIYTSLRAPPVF